MEPLGANGGKVGVGFPRLKDPLSASLSSVCVRVAIRFHKLSV